MDAQHPVQNLLDLVDFVFWALSPQLRRHLHTASASDLHEPSAGLDVLVVDPQRWTMLQRPKCAEDWWPNIARMFIQHVVQTPVDDVLVVQAVQLAHDALDVRRYFFWEVCPW